MLSAQTTNGSIVGHVTDESGGVVPGVTVAASSPSLQVPEVTTVSDGEGAYRLTQLPLGTYTVTYSLDGFQRISREGVRLTAGFTATIDVALKVGALSESVTVSGASPVVDVASTTNKTSFTRESLDLIPTSRNGVGAILVQTPGAKSFVDVGGEPTRTAIFSALGNREQAWPTVEGVLVTSPKQGAQSSYNDFTTLEEAQVRTMGNDAEVPTRGLNVTMILKSGSNEFHGSGWWFFSNENMLSDNVDARLEGLGFLHRQPIVKRWDVAADLGGRIIRDKLWFYVSARDRRNDERSLDAFETDGSPRLGYNETPYQTEKISYQINPSHRLIGFYQYSFQYRHPAPARLLAPESRSQLHQNGQTAKVEWQGIFGNSAVAAFQWGMWGWRQESTNYTDAPKAIDIVTQRTTGQGNDYAPGHPGEGRPLHFRGSLGWYKPDFFHGKHDVKVGFDFTSNVINWRFDSRIKGDYDLQFSNGAADQVVILNRPVNPVTRSHYTGVFVKDNWTIGRRLTLDLGVRLAHDSLFVPEQSRPDGQFYPATTYEAVQFKIWKSIVPRLRLAYDIGGNGKTVLRGGWGRFAEMRGVDEGEPANQNAYTRTYYRWRDVNGNRLFDIGESNLNPNGPDFVRLLAGQAFSDTGSAGNMLINPDEGQPKTDEFTLALERELIPNFALQFSGAHTRQYDVRRLLNTKRPYEAFNIAITSRDPGLDGVVGNSDDPGSSLTYYDYPAALRGLAFQLPMYINDPQANRTWTTMQVAASKRLSNRWQMSASYSATKIDDPFIYNAGGGLDYGINTVDPNSEINSANQTWEWLAKGSGGYQFPWDVLASANFEHRSGDAYARTVLLRGGVQIPSLVVRAEPISSRRTPNLNLMDFRLDKSFRIGGSRKLSVRLDVFNALNINSALTVQPRSGPDFGRPLTIISPRQFQIGGAFTF